MGSLALKDGLKDASVTTYDIIKWDELTSQPILKIQTLINL